MNTPRFFSSRSLRFVLVFVLGLAILPSMALADSGTAPATKRKHPDSSVTKRGLTTLPTVGESRDYATEVFGDPWDYSNAEDVNIDKGPVINADKAYLADGLLHFDYRISGHFYPVWPGWDDGQNPTRHGALRLGRDGAVNPIDADVYTKLSLLQYRETSGDDQISFATCPHLESWSCWRSVVFRAGAGWQLNDIDLKAMSKSWKGKIYGLRYTSTFASPHQVKIDWMRVHAPGKIIDLSNIITSSDDTFAIDTNSSNSDNTNKGGQGWGIISDRYLDTGALPAGTYRLGKDPKRFSHTITVEGSPQLIFDNPSIAGGEDYATAVLHDPWDFNQPSDVASMKNVTEVRFADSKLYGTNGDQKNDPYIVMRDNGNLQADKYHRVTIKASYEGPFDLKLTEGGGTHGRISWLVGNDPVWRQTSEIVMHKNESSWTIPLKDYRYPDELMEADIPGQSTWGEGGPIHSLRWDPNEDPGSRKWSIDDIRLAADNEAVNHFTFQWHDNNFRPGTTLDLYADTAMSGFQGEKIASNVPVTGKSSTFDWTVNIPDGTYYIWAKVHSPDRLATQRVYATGPLHVRSDGQHVPAKPVEPAKPSTPAKPAKPVAPAKPSTPAKPVAPPPTADPHSAIRAAGPSRVETAIALSTLSYPNKTNTAILATAATYPDALAAAPLAAQLHAPVLLTQPDTLHGNTLEELKRLGVTNVIILGGKHAISDNVMQQLGAIGIKTERLSGPNRIQTAIAIAQYLVAKSKDKPEEAVIVDASRFQDALAVASFAIEHNAPILLSYKEGLDKLVVKMLQEAKIRKVHVVSTNSATMALPYSTLNDFDLNPHRLRAATPAALTALIAKQLHSTKVVVASANDFPDALAAAPAAHALQGSLLLAGKTSKNEAIIEAIKKNRVTDITIAGGSKAVPSEVITPILKAVTPKK